MARLIRFDAHARRPAEDLGLIWAAIEATFLCLDYTPPLSTLISGCPDQPAQYQARESRASGQTPLSIKSGKFQVYNPRTGESLSTTLSLTFPWSERLNGIIFVPLVYVLCDGKSTIYAVTYGLTGRIMYLYIPDLDLAFYELSEANAKIIAAEFEANFGFIENWHAQWGAERHRKVIGVIDMVRNYGHHMINHLSGIDLLVREDCEHFVEEYWVYGQEFFGPIEELYPELARKVKVLS